jgi:hypothetical protein
MMQGQTQIKSTIYYFNTVGWVTLTENAIRYCDVESKQVNISYKK